MSVVSDILKAASEIHNSRNIASVFTHLQTEVFELHVEVDNVICGKDAGEDGVIGEAVDIVICAIDIIYQSQHNISENEIAAIVSKKLAKWKYKYGQVVE